MKGFVAFFVWLIEVIKPHLPEIKGFLQGLLVSDYLKTKQENRELLEIEEVRRDARAVPDDKHTEWLRKHGLLREDKVPPTKPE